MATRTFEAQVLVTGLHDPYTVRVHADDPEEVGGKLNALVPHLRRVWEFKEVPAPRASLIEGYVVTLRDGSLSWTGESDTFAGPDHRGAHSAVTVGTDGAILVELYAPGIDAPFAPIDDSEEKLALRAALRTMARDLADRNEDVARLEAAAAGRVAPAEGAATIAGWMQGDGSPPAPQDDQTWLDTHANRN
jgi:hypothetical protein